MIHQAPQSEGQPLKIKKEHWTQMDSQNLSHQFLTAVKNSNADPDLKSR
jgi:hypothetical protein